jgi:hypothetical protein
VTLPVSLDPPSPDHTIPFIFLNAALLPPPPSQWLGPTVESQDPGARPLLVGEVNRASHRMMWLSHGLFRSGVVPDPYGPTSLGGGAEGTMREGVGEVGDVVVRGASNA